MKTNILLLICIMGTNIIGFSQNSSEKLPKNTNTIILKLTGDATKELTKFANHLQDKGFTIEKLDNTLLSLSTDNKGFKVGGRYANLRIKAYSRQNDSLVSIIISGKVEVSGLGGGQIPFDACNCGIAGDARKGGFNVIRDSVEGFTFDTIEYETR